MLNFKTPKAQLLRRKWEADGSYMASFFTRAIDAEGGAQAFWRCEHTESPLMA